MLLCLPFLQTDSSNQPPQAPWFAADNVYEYFLDWNSTNTEADRLRYERAILKYLYYHNWFSGTVADWIPSEAYGPTSFQSHVFWIGVMTSDVAQKSVLKNWRQDAFL